MQTSLRTYTPPRGPRESLIYANKGEQAVLRRMGGKGRPAPGSHGIPSFWTDRGDNAGPSGGGMGPGAGASRGLMGAGYNPGAGHWTNMTGLQRYNAAGGATQYEHPDASRGAMGATESPWGGHGGSNPDTGSGAEHPGASRGLMGTTDLTNWNTPATVAPKAAPGGDGWFGSYRTPTSPPASSPAPTAQPAEKVVSVDPYYSPYGIHGWGAQNPSGTLTSPYDVPTPPSDLGPRAGATPQWENPNQTNMMNGYPTSGLSGDFNHSYSFTGQGQPGAVQNAGPRGDWSNAYYADGGRPPVGKLAVVGERGPELFVPDRPGTIIPNAGNGTSLMQMLTGGAPAFAQPRQDWGQMNFLRQAPEGFAGPRQTGDRPMTTPFKMFSFDHYQSLPDAKRQGFAAAQAQAWAQNRHYSPYDFLREAA